MGALKLWLSFACAHLLMCAGFTITLAIPTGWEVAIVAGPFLYVQLLLAAHGMRCIRTLKDQSVD